MTAQQTPHQNTAPPLSWEHLEPSLRAAISGMTEQELSSLEEAILPAAEAARLDQLSTYRPYPKQREFHAAGSTHRERLLLAANQVGKSKAAAAEVAMHLTGRYPSWWTGKRFTKSVVFWAAAVSGEDTRKNPQRLLLGRDQQWGTGAIPKDCIHGEPIMARGVPGLVDTVRVKHASGMISTLAFKSYEQGREKWQGETIDGVWYDEEPPLDIYTEGLTRTNIGLGPVLITFTPLMGESAVVKRFKREQSADRITVSMTLEDAEHYTPEARKTIEASYPEHEREARARGIPVLGSGLVFPVARSVLAVNAFPIPPHWARIGGLDFGYDHPTAAVEMCHDRDADVIYITKTYRQRLQTPLVHAGALKPWNGSAAPLPWAWPHDGLAHDKGGSCEQLAAQYRGHGLEMLPERATFDDGTNGVEAGVTEMLDRMMTGRWKVFAHLNDWFEEFQGYHRKGGIIVKEADDLMSASRYAYMMRRNAVTTEPLPSDRYAARDRYNKSQGGRGSPMAA